MVVLEVMIKHSAVQALVQMLKDKAKVIQVLVLVVAHPVQAEVVQTSQAIKVKIRIADHVHIPFHQPSVVYVPLSLYLVFSSLPSLAIR